MTDEPRWEDADERLYEAARVDWRDQDDDDGCDGDCDGCDPGDSCCKGGRA